MTSNPRRALDRWARDHADCISFDTFLAIGGTLAVARQDITMRINRLSDALQALRAYGQEDLDASAEAALTVAHRAQDSQPPAMRGSLVPGPAPSIAGRATTLVPSPERRENPDQRATIGPEALARLEAEQHGEPPDPENAHVQGANDAE